MTRLDRDNGQRALDRSLRRTIAPTLAATSIAYAIGAVTHFILGGTDRVVIFPTEAVTSLAAVLGAIWLSDSRRVVTPPVLYGIVALLSATILIDELIFFSVYDYAHHPVVLYVLVLGLGFSAAIPTGLFAALMSGPLLVVAFSALRASDELSRWVEPLLVQTAFISLGVISRSWARAYFAQIQALHRENQENAAARDAALSHYRELTEMANDLIAEIDSDGRLLYANPAHRAAFGFSTEALEGSRIGDVLNAEVDTPGGLLDSMQRGPQGPTEVRITRADGCPRVLEIRSRPFVMASGERRIVVTSRDVTERVGLEAERARQRERLETLVEERTTALRTSIVELQRRERLASVGTLAAGIAHQINNPVGAILLSSQFALAQARSADRDEEVARLREALEVNVDEAMRCGEIVRNLLRFARDEPVRRERVDLGELVERVVDLCRPYAASRHAALVDAIDPGRHFVEANSVELEEALINLIRNAIEAQPIGVRVEVGLRTVESDAVVVIEDDGHGMDEERRDRIFDPFYTTRLAAGGTGLGLSVAHGIVTSHEGTLSAESEIGKGTRMRIVLPLSEGRAGAQEIEAR